MVTLVVDWTATLSSVARSLCYGLIAYGVTFPVQAEKLTSVADLRYGVVLYEYFQQNYMAALSELMVAEARGGIQGHKENPKLIEGGISLAFGMENKASAIFQQLLDEQQPQDVRNTAWYYLAKLRYQQGDWQGSQESLSRIGQNGKLDRRLASDRLALAVNLAIRQGELVVAEQLLQRFPKNDPLLPYVYYNLGAAYSRNNQHTQALPFYEQLVHLTESDFQFNDSSPTTIQQTNVQQASVKQQQREILALYDKSLTAAGYSLMLQGQYQSAIDQFVRVRRESEFSRRALLGYGWAAAQAEDYQLALQPWQVLGRGSLTHATVQEAVLAVPYAYEKLGAQGQALQAFGLAQAAFEQEMARLDQVADMVAQSPLDDFLQVQTDQHGWLSLDQQMGNAPQRAYLTRLFAQNEFQGSVQELQDLITLQQQLEQWNKKLEMYQYSWEERQQARLEKQQLLAQQPWQQQSQQLHNNQQYLLRKLEKLVADKDYIGLAPESVRSLHQRVVRGQAHLARLEAAVARGDSAITAERLNEYREQLRFFHGLLFWQGSDVFHQQVWQQRSSLSQLSDHFAQLEENQQRFEAALSSAPDITPFAGRIEQLSARLQQQRQQVAVAKNQVETRLTQRVVQHLQQQRQRLKHYLAQARLSTARLYDAALQEQQP
ncbi:hypothetical protein R50073_38870 [Maricurvus nonylphenolicus]|uniref:hypothetical protein n=1 Tax=Maricurvus nonylphenolicus TaxID=1008307 RepID=UPI0036F21724